MTPCSPSMLVHFHDIGDDPTEGPFCFLSPVTCLIPMIQANTGSTEYICKSPWVQDWQVREHYSLVSIQAALGFNSFGVMLTPQIPCATPLIVSWHGQFAYAYWHVQKQTCNISNTFVNVQSLPQNPSPGWICCTQPSVSTVHEVMVTPRLQTRQTANSAQRTLQRKWGGQVLDSGDRRCGFVGC
jgi:hypothetical protein